MLLLGGLDQWGASIKGNRVDIGTLFNEHHDNIEVFCRSLDCIKQRSLLVHISVVQLGFHVQQCLHK